MSDNETPDFEASITELETLVSALESGDLSLEESLQTFERGIKLTRTCQSALQQAEQRVNILLEKDGETVSQAFDSDDSSDHEPVA